MLDAGWNVRLFKNELGAYTAIATHGKQDIIDRANRLLRGRLEENGFPEDSIDDVLDQSEIVTDDFTPEQALTRLSYKVHGEIVAS